jgi:hypothetical protein
MLADARSSALASNFAGQWLETRNLEAVQPDPKKFPEFTPELRDAMKTETTMFFDYVLKEDRPISEFLNANYTFLNERLAKFYGIAGVSGPEFRRVELTTDQRGGILSQASVLTVSSYPNRTSPVIRGKYVLGNILGTPPPPPPAGRAESRRSRPGNGQFDAPAAGKTSVELDLRRLPLAHGPVRIWVGELRRHRTMANHGR